MNHQKKPQWSHPRLKDLQASAQGSELREAIREEIQTLHQRGYSAREIARELGASHQHILNLAKGWGIRFPSRAATPHIPRPTLWRWMQALEDGQGSIVLSEMRELIGAKS